MTEQTAPHHKRKTVIMAMTGQTSSNVAAYLLKKQGIRVIGLCVLWFENELQKQIYSPWHIAQIDDVKKTCEQLDIEFYGVQGQDYFSAMVEEGLLSAKIMGQQFCLDMAFHTALIHLLEEKALSLGADAIATGHFAKITKNQSTGLFNLMTANDLAIDQAHLLSKLSQTSLAKLLLPLAEMNESQVQKLAKALDMNRTPPVKRKESAARQQVIFDQYFKASVAQSFFKSGIFRQLHFQEALADHDGYHLYSLAQKNLADNTQANLDSRFQVVQINALTAEVIVEFSENCRTKHIVLHSMVLDQTLDLSRPIEIAFKVGTSPDYAQGLLIFKNSGHGAIECAATLSQYIAPGEHLTFFNKIGTNAKVLGSGVVESAGVPLFGRLVASLPETEEEGEARPKNLEVGIGF